ncbi:MAG: O-antigen ligase family protein [Bacteroidota bacterium]
MHKLEISFFLVLLLLNLFCLQNNLKAETLFMDRAWGNEKLNPITTGMQASWLLLFSIFFLFVKKGVSLYLKVLSIPAIGIAVFNILISSSKSSFLFIGICVLIMIGLRKSSKGTLKAIAFFVVVTTIILSTFSNSGEYLALASSRLEYFGNDLSAVERVDSYGGAYKQFIESPLIGDFLEEKQTKQYPHNLILEAFMALGIFGGVLFIIILVVFTYNSIKFISAFPRSPIPYVVLSAITIAMTSGGLSISYDFWQQLAMCTGLMWNQKNYLKSTRAIKSPPGDASPGAEPTNKLIVPQT